ncbi:MAG: hypothetical protein WAT39_16410 [Planctomycetota bacterium]
MRGSAPTSLCLFALAGGCTSTVFAEPRILVSPYFTNYQVRGEVAVQSQQGLLGPIVDNAPQPLRSFGQDHYRDDIGVRADIGDGFGGVRFDWFKLDQNSARPNVLGDDWGNLLATDLVRMQVEMDELRIGYVEPLATVRTTWRNQPLVLRGGLGGTFVWRDLVLRARTDDGVRAQNVGIDGEIVAIAGRFRASWRDFAFDADYEVSPQIVIGGDFEGLLQDLELRASWTMTQHDVTFFAGYRLSTFAAAGSAGGFAYDADLTIDGFQAGVSVVF